MNVLTSEKEKKVALPTYDFSQMQRDPQFDFVQESARPNTEAAVDRVLDRDSSKWTDMVADDTYGTVLARPGKEGAYEILHFPELTCGAKAHNLTPYLMERVRASVSSDYINQACRRRRVIVTGLGTENPRMILSPR